MIRKITLLFACILALCSCSKDIDQTTENTDGTLTNQSEALSQFDSSPGGVYKGVVTASDFTGHFTIRIHNGNNLSTCKLAYNGKSYDLTCPELSSWQGEAISGAVFTGRNSADEEISLQFYSNGVQVNAYLQLPEGGPNVSVYKEYSTSQVKAFEGSATSGNPSLLAVLTRGSDFRMLNTTGVNWGSITNQALSIQMPNNVNFNGTLGQNGLQGTWTLGSSTNSWSAQRTL